ncbi:MAG: tripartite tricarboxylate transporter substrate binding protein [Burkholderiales bacterium]
MNHARRFALFCVIALAPLLAAAADYPSGPLRLVVGFAPGGGTDGAARLIADKLGPELGQTVVIENRVGAGGTIGAQSVARATPDGYTLFFGTGAELVINPLTRKSAPYDLLKDFIPVAEVGAVTFVLVVPAASPADSVQGLVAAAQARPHGLQFASFGVGSTNHLIGEMFLQATGMKAVHVPYKGSQPAMLALLAGDIDFTFETTAVALPLIKAGKLKALATPSPQRLKDLPSVPTLQEAGFKDLLAEGWMGVFAPVGTPPAIVQRVNEALAKVLRLPEIHDKLTERGVKVAVSTSDEYKRKLAGEMDKWRRVIKDAGITLNE